MNLADLLSHRSVMLRRAGAESIRELVFGVEDGVVQNATLIAGMAGASLSAGVIVVAGVINAAAGVLSMSIGTYLSSKAERDVRTSTIGEGGSLGFGKAALSGQSRWRSGLEMLLLASVAGVLGYLIGVVGRVVFDVDF
jgi:VIT1/CCC1 family predicted Fe2+/Mn2+ transporter